jgi:hypothetical protein
MKMFRESYIVVNQGKKKREKNYLHLYAFVVEKKTKPK